jgi:Asp-tRNA(Asn)/Glu-tRNA(Gln) amidotransferase A subunit family amidase
MQLAGPAWSEATVLCAGHAYQQTADCHRQMPPAA